MTFEFQIPRAAQSRRISLLLISRGKGFRNNFGVLFDDLEYALLV